MVARFEPDLLDDEDPFAIDAQAAHLFKHPHLGIEDINDAWLSDPLFYPANTPGALAQVGRGSRSGASCAAGSRSQR